MDTERRTFLALSGLGAAALTLGSGDVSAEAALSDLEQANTDLVNAFCATWESMDVEKLMGFMADDIAFRMIDTAPMVNGRAALTQGMAGFLSTRTGARFEVLRSHAMGNIVINQRIDHFERKDGEDAFEVTGVFLVKEGKIVEWRDYMTPQGS